MVIPWSSRIITQNNRDTRARPWLLLAILPYLVFANFGDLMHAPSCPERQLLRWLGSRTHGAQAGASHSDLGAQPDHDCPACLWAGHATGKVLPPAEITPATRTEEINFISRSGVPHRALSLTRHNRGPPLFVG